ncbi:hypothetical protein N9L47_13515 [Rhodobacteraceae bacterium]|nr:hypothetical protein [Paracoccaceae bacterium]
MSEFLIRVPRQSEVPWFTPPNTSVDTAVYNSMIASLRSEAGRFGYGVSDQEIAQRYQFVTKDDARKFFANIKNVNPTLFRTIDGHEAPESLVANVQSSTDPRGIDNADRLFRHRARELAEQINNSDRAYFRVVVGPTGSGKTAFSKGLFCAGVREFWKSKIIPSRIEYRWSKDKDLGKYLMWAAGRDLLIYLVIYLEQKPFETLMEKLGIADAWKELHELRVGHGAPRLAKSGQEQERWLLSISEAVKETKLIETNGWMKDLVHLSVRELGIKFLFSFDGFDAMNALEVFSPSQMSEPVRKLEKFIGGGFIEGRQSEIFSRNANAHFLIYVRDTTLKVIERSLTQFRLNKDRPDHLWICPPSYRAVASIMARRIGNEKVTASARKKFVDRVVNALRHEIEGHTSAGGSRPVSAVFSWNTRNMKNHVARTWRILFNRHTQERAEFLERIENIGVGQFLFREFMTDSRSTAIRSYDMQRSLVFQNDTGEIGVRFGATENQIFDMFQGARFDDAVLERVNSNLDDGTIGDCIFNPFFDEGYPIDERTIALAPLLVLGRVKHSRNGFVAGKMIHRFLVSTGSLSDVPESRKVTELLLGWMVSVGLLSPSTAVRSSSPIALTYYITSCGEFKLNHAAFCVSYLDSACFTAYWTEALHDSAQFQHAANSVDESIVWAVANASKLFVHLLETEELIKAQMLTQTPAMFKQHKRALNIVSDAKESFISESRSILSASRKSIQVSDAGLKAEEALGCLEVGT